MSHLWWAEREVDARTWFGARMSVNAQEIVGRYIAYFGIWEPSLTAWMMGRLQPGDTFVDVGANVGYFTLLASRAVGAAGCVISIEPSPANSAMLRRNVAANHADNVRVVEAAVSDREGELPLFGEGVDGKVTLEAEWARAHALKQIGSVPVKPLSSLVDRSPAVIKVDVEGHEIPVLRSAIPLLADHPSVAVEALTGNVAAAQEVMTPFGYDTLEMHNDYAVATYIHRVVHEPEPLAPLHGRDQVDLVFI
jgi:FkbM family methyltransferase